MYRQTNNRLRRGRLPVHYLLEWCKKKQMRFKPHLSRMQYSTSVLQQIIKIYTINYRDNVKLCDSIKKIIFRRDSSIQHRYSLRKEIFSEIGTISYLHSKEITAQAQGLAVRFSSRAKSHPRWVTSGGRLITIHALARCTKSCELSYENKKLHNDMK